VLIKFDTIPFWAKKRRGRTWTISARCSGTLRNEKNRVEKNGEKRNNSILLRKGPFSNRGEKNLTQSTISDDATEYSLGKKDGPVNWGRRKFKGFNRGFEERGKAGASVAKSRIEEKS